MLNSEQMTELVDIREQFVSRFFTNWMSSLSLEHVAALSTEQVKQITDQGYQEFRLRYPQLNNEFSPHLPQHALRESWVSGG